MTNDIIQVRVFTEGRWRWRHLVGPGESGGWSTSYQCEGDAWCAAIQQYGPPASIAKVDTDKAEVEKLPVEPSPIFEMELRDLINSHSLENASNSSDWILAGYLMDCLHAFDKATNHRTRWHGLTAAVARVESALEAR